MQTLRGSCLCGDVTFAVDRTFDKMFMCSCDQCRQITGSAFAANLFTDNAGFNWLSGEDNIATYQMPEGTSPNRFAGSAALASRGPAATALK